MGCVCSTESRRQSKAEKEGHAPRGGSDDPLMVETGPTTNSKDGNGKICTRNCLQMWSARSEIIHKVSEGSLIDKVGKAIDHRSKAVLTLHNWFPRAGKFQGNKISILAFEVANTVGKAANLMQALSDKSVEFLKAVVLKSQGVRQLVSRDTMELLRIVAADQREEFRVFSAEVVRFGNLCKDAQWHNLDRYFQNLDMDRSPRAKLELEATETIQELIVLAHHTCELYHEINAYDRIQQDYKRKQQEEESMPASLRGEGLAIYDGELKRQHKIIKSLKKKSFWSRKLHEVVEQFIEVVSYLHIATSETFNLNGADIANCQRIRTPQRLGTCALELHYANIINQITNIVSRPLSFNQSTRDTFYHGLPASVKAVLRSRLQQFDVKGEPNSVQIKAEMHKILQWLSPLAESTVKAHQDFGWVGEFANAGIEFNNTPIYTHKITRIQTLYHADKEKTEESILELVVWLHHLVKQVKARGYESKTKYPFHKDERMPLRIKAPPPSPPLNGKTIQLQFSPEEKDMLECAKNKGRVMIRSRSLDSTGEKENRGKSRRGSSKSSGGSSMEFSSDAIFQQNWTQHSNSLHELDTFD